MLHNHDGRRQHEHLVAIALDRRGWRDHTVRYARVFKKQCLRCVAFERIFRRSVLFLAHARAHLALYIRQSTPSVTLLNPG